MRYSIESKDKIYVKGYGFLSFAKNMGNKYSKKLLDSAKKFTTDAVKTASKSAIQKIVEAKDDLIGNEIANKIISVSTELHSKNSSKELHSEKEEANNKIPKERYISAEKKQQIIDELRLV